MKKRLYLILVGVVIITGCVKYIENKFTFYPEKRIEFYPSVFNLDFEDVYVKTEDEIRINGWFIPQSNVKYTLLFLHGNGGNIGTRLKKLLMLHNTGINIFIIDYRGFGKSKGKGSEKGLYFDAKAAYNYLVDIRGIQPEQIILYGESLGAAVAIDLACNAKVKAIIVEGAFSRGRDMADKLCPILPKPFFSNSYDSLKKIENVQVPKLFIHSRNDEIVPFALANKLYNASPEPKELVEIDGGHNTAFLVSQKKYISSIGLFIEKL